MRDNIDDGGNGALSTMTLDGEDVGFTPGETVYEVSERYRREIPTLCYDERLEPFGGCRLCIVEVEGSHNPVASCTTKAAQGMKVTTKSGRLEMHRRVLLELVASENRDLDVDPMSGYASGEMATLLDRYDARTGRFLGLRSGTSHPDDPNPFILRDYENYLLFPVCAGLRRAGGRLRHQRDEPGIRNADHHRVRWNPQRLGVHLLWAVHPDLPDGGARRLEGARKQGRAG